MTALLSPGSSLSYLHSVTSAVYKDNCNREPKGHPVKLGVEAASELLLENKPADETIDYTGSFSRRSEITIINEKTPTVKNSI